MHLLRPFGPVCTGLCLLAGVASAQTTIPTYYFTTLAGATSAGSADGPGETARFDRPQGVAIDAAGNIFVADSGNNSVRKISPAGVVSTVAGKAGEYGGTDGPGTSARFRDVGDIVIDRLGDLFVTDDVAVRRIGPDGQVTTLAGFQGAGTTTDASRDGTGTDARFEDLGGLAIDPAGTLYVTEPGRHTIRRVTPAGVVTTLAGSGSPGHADGKGAAASFWVPSDICADAAGTLYVADFYNHTVRKVLADGTVSTLAGTAGDFGVYDGQGAAAGFKHPRGVATDLAGNVYVSDSYNQSIRRIAPGGAVTTLAGQPPQYDYVDYFIFNPPGSADGKGREAAFNRPAGLATDASGNVYVADYGNNLVRKVTPDGVVTTLAGLAPDRAVGSSDGVGIAARFNAPRGLAVTPQGVCYVADTGNHVIRRIAEDGTVTTLAGTVGIAGYADGPGAVARFDAPHDLALDPAGNLYVIDSSNAVRKLTPAGIVTTLAGGGQVPRVSVDGQHTAASFGHLSCIAVSAQGEVYVGEITGTPEPFSARVRKITPTGLVTTPSWTFASHTVLTGMAVGANGVLYACDESYQSVYQLSSAGVEKVNVPSFFPYRIAIDATGGVFLSEDADSGSVRVARLWSDGRLDILGGRMFRGGHQDGLGTEALFRGIGGIGVDAAGSLYIACANGTIRKGLVAGPPVIVTQPQSQTVVAGASVQFSVTATAVPEAKYQWSLNGIPINGATAAGYTVSALSPAGVGEYTVTVTNELGSITSNKALLAIASPAGPPAGTGGSTGGGGAPSIGFAAALAGLGGWRGLARQISARAPTRNS